jgi:hypothetical protein
LEVIAIPDKTSMRRWDGKSICELLSTVLARSTLLEGSVDGDFVFFFAENVKGIRGLRTGKWFGIWNLPFCFVE